MSKQDPIKAVRDLHDDDLGRNQMLMVFASGHDAAQGMLEPIRSAEMRQAVAFANVYDEEGTLSA
jgi:hypothetical protein